MMGKRIFIAAALAAVLGLTACASIDPAPVQSELATASGIQGAHVAVSHPGAPWNTESTLTLYVADVSTDGVTAAVRSAVSTLARTPLATHPVTIFVVPGKPADYSPAHPGIDARIDDLTAVAGALGLRIRSPGDYLYLTPDDIHRLSGEQ